MTARVPSDPAKSCFKIVPVLSLEAAGLGQNPPVGSTTSRPGIDPYIPVQAFGSSAARVSSEFRRQRTLAPKESGKKRPFSSALYEGLQKNDTS